MHLVKDRYEDARTQVNTSIGVTGKITVRMGLGLHQGSSLSLYLFDMTFDVMERDAIANGASKSNPIGGCCLQTT